MAFAITIQTAQNVNGTLSVIYAKNGDSGGHGINWLTARLADFTIDEAELEQFMLRGLLTWAVRRGVTAAQMEGKTFTFNLGALANLITVS